MAESAQSKACENLVDAGPLAAAAALPLWLSLPLPLPLWLLLPGGCRSMDY